MVRLVVVVLSLALTSGVAFADGPGTSTVNKDVRAFYKKNGHKDAVVKLGPAKDSTNWEMSTKVVAGRTLPRAARKWETVFPGPIKGSKKVLEAWVYYLQHGKKWVFEDLQGHSVKNVGLPTPKATDLTIADWTKAFHRNMPDVLVELQSVALASGTWTWESSMKAGQCEGSATLIVAANGKSGTMTVPVKIRFSREADTGPFTRAEDRGSAASNPKRAVKSASKSWTGGERALFKDANPGAALVPTGAVTFAETVEAPAAGGRGGRRGR